MFLLPSPDLFASLVPIFVGHVQITLINVSMEQKRLVLVLTRTIE